MKSKIKSALLGLTGVAFLANPAMGAVTLESGSLAVAFYQVISNVVQPNTYVFDLGQASNYRENAARVISVSAVTGGPASANIAADLVTAFGAGWANDGTVRWSVVGTRESVGNAVVAGDTLRTSYLSRAVNPVPGSGQSTTFGATISSTNRGILNTQILSFFNGVNNATSGSNADGAIILRTAPNTVDEFLSPTSTLSFGIGNGYNPSQTLNAGSISNLSAATGTIEGALDLYRILHITAGADLTSGYSTGDAALGQGQYMGTLLLDSTGNLSIVPEPSSALLGAAGVLGLCLRRRRNA